MRIYKDRTIAIPRDVNLTELLHSSAGPTPLPESHLVATDSLTNRSITLGELRDRAGRLAHGFHRTLAPREGDCWAVILPNCVEYIECFHALLWVGGVGCPVNHAIPAREIAHGLAVTRPRFVLAYGPALEKIQEAVRLAREQLRRENESWDDPTLITVITKAPGLPHLPNDFLDDERLPIPHYDDTDAHAATVHLSSGTTGAPKGVGLTHYNLVANCHQMYAHDAAQFGPASRTVVYTPFVHIAMTTPPLFLGPWTGMLHHAMPSFDLETFGGLVQSTRATVFQGVPSVLLAFAHSDLTARYDFSSARLIMAGSLLKDALVEKLHSRAPWRILQLYGMTEASPFVAHQTLSDHDIPPGSVGRLLPNVEARLMLTGTTTDAPPGGPGELWLRGPNITRGYWRNPGANATAFPAPGWYNTGDVCTISPAGVLAVVGRTKELIKYKGFQVSPAELEAHLNTHPRVVEAGVAAVWDEGQLTELPAAYVILKGGLQGEEAVSALREIHRDVDGLVAGYKKLRGGVWNVDRLPKNATGKILRKQLPERRLGLCSLGGEEVKARL